MLERSCQFLPLGLGEPDFLWTNVIVHPREGLQALHLVAEQVVHFIQGRLAQSCGFGLCQIRGDLEHGGECPADDFGILDQFVGGAFLKVPPPGRSADILKFMTNHQADWRRRKKAIRMEAWRGDGFQHKDQLQQQSPLVGSGKHGKGTGSSFGPQQQVHGPATIG